MFINFHICLYFFFEILYIFYNIYLVFIKKSQDGVGFCQYPYNILLSFPSVDTFAPIIYNHKCINKYNINTSYININTLIYRIYRYIFVSIFGYFVELPKRMYNIMCFIKINVSENICRFPMVISHTKTYIISIYL